MTIFFAFHCMNGNGILRSIALFFNHICTCAGGECRLEGLTYLTAGAIAQPIF